MSPSPTSDGTDDGGRLQPADPAAVVAVEGDDGFVFPLTPQQAGLWRKEQAHPGRSNFNGAFLFEITGPVRPHLVEAAFNVLLERHEILRACVRETADGPGLVVLPSLTARCSVSDLRLLSREAAQARVEELTRVEARTPFNVSAPPLARVGLIRIEDQRSILMLTLHHIVCDGWTLGALAIELTQHYETLAEGGTPDTTPPPLQFGDYATWLETELGEPAMQAQLDYWRNTLANYRRFDLTGDLTVGHPDIGGDIDSDIVARQLPADLVDRFQSITTAAGGTFFTSALATLTAVLASASGRRDVTLGVPVVGRDQPELEPVMGPLINYVLLRSQIADGDTFASLEQRVRQDAFDAFANQSVPLETVAEAMAATGRPLPDPVYSICFVSQLGYGNANPIRPFADCHLRSLPSVSSGSIYDLFFFLVKRETGYRLSVDFRTAKFERAYVEALLDSFVAVMEQVGRNPSTSIDALAKLTTAVIVPAAAIDEPSNQQSNTQQDAGGDGETYVLPASIVQERYWLLANADPSSTALHVPACIRITGELDRDALVRSLDTVAGRHEALGTAFKSIDGVLHQVVTAHRSLPLEHADLSEFPKATRDQALHDALSADTARPFDLEAGPLVRSRLYRLSEREHVLAQTFHHAICDGQSVQILQRELWQGYEAIRNGQQPNLPPLDIQYADYAASEQEMLSSDVAESQIGYWTKALSGVLPVLDFPLEQPPLNRKSAINAIERIAIPDQCATRLKAMARASGSTMFAATATAFAVLLARYGRGTDILFGCPVANRTAETASVFGPFAGPLALRIDLSGDPTLAEALVRVREVSLDALSATDVPFDRIVQSVDARSVGGRNPLFQFYFVYQQAFLQAQSVAGLEIEPVPTFATGTPFELQIVMIERAGQVSAQVDYNPELLSKRSVETILRYFADVLDLLSTAPESTRISQLPEPELGSATRFGTERTERAFLAPRTATETKLAEIWQRLLKRDGVGVHDDFFDLGGQSILAARMVIEIERAFDTRIQISTLAHARTIEQLAAVIESPEAGRSLVIPMRPSGSQTPLFVVHCGGGHVLRYEDLVSLLDRNQPVYGIAAPPLEPDDRTTTVEALAERYIAEMRKVRPHGPYRLAGYSFGGLVAYEMARQLSLQGETIEVVAILDTVNRIHYARLSSLERGRMAGLYVTDRGGRHLRRLRDHGLKAFANEALAALSRKARPLLMKLKRRLPAAATGAPNATAGEAGAHADVVPVNHNLAIFARIASRYRPKPYAGRVLVVHADQRGAEYLANPTLGWEELAAFGAEAVFVPGDHMSFMRKPHVERLAAILTEHLARPATARIGGEPR